MLEKLEQKQAAQGGALNETQTSIKGEALLIRAYGHFLLANIFCEAYRGPELSKTLLGIPYIKKPETTVKPHYERGHSPRPTPTSRAISWRLSDWIC